MNKFEQFKAKNPVLFMRPFEEGEVLPESVFISPDDAANGSPKVGDMIAYGEGEEANLCLIPENLLHRFEKTTKPIPRASLCRMVIYHTTAAEREMMDKSICCNIQEHLPATVVANFTPEGHADQCLNLKVDLDGDGQLWKTSINMGEGEGQWSWPVFK